MEHRTTLIRNVEIPSTLPSMDTLTDLKGSLILKEVTPEDNALRIEGDLLWRGYFQESEDCLWEGAEYFSETIRSEELRGTEISTIEPQILSLTGESVSDSNYRLTFDIRWCETAENVRETAEEKEEAVQHVCTCHNEPPKEDQRTDLDDKLEKIETTWKETVKAINEPIREESKKQAKEEPRTEEAAEEVEIKCCPYSKFCLRYYRTQDGDELERIAEKFSATVAKLKEFNKLESSELSAGRMLRIP